MRLYSLILGVCLLCFMQETKGQDDYVLPKDSVSMSNKVQTNVSLGTGVGVSNNGSYFTTFVRPTFLYEVSPRFALYSGVGYYNYQFDNYPVLGDLRFQQFSGNLSQMQAFVGGQYTINERLKARAEVFYNLYQTQIPGTAQNTSVDFQRFGFAGAIQYKLRDNIYLEAEFRMNEFNRTPGRGYNAFGDHGFGSGSFMRANSPVFFPPVF